MSFCRTCGTRLAPVTPPAVAPAALAPSVPAAVPAPAPAGRIARESAPAPAGRIARESAPAPAAGSVPVPAPAPIDHARAPAPVGVPAAAGGAGSAPVAARRSCPTCGGLTPAGFAFCQLCGNRIPQIPPSPPQVVSGETGGSGRMAAVPVGSPAPAQTAPDLAPAWGALVSIHHDGSDGRRHPLAGEWVSIGRDGADISFPADQCLAREHARLELRGGQPTLIPLDRMNGVYRRVVEAAELHDGALILLGREVLRFELVGDEERSAGPLVRHGVTMFGSPLREAWGRLTQMLPNGNIRDVRHLVGDEVIMGREEGVVVFRDDEFLSRRHLALRWDGRRCTIEDLGSSNGTFVRLGGPTPLRPGDHLRLGEQMLRFDPQRS